MDKIKEIFGKDRKVEAKAQGLEWQYPAVVATDQNTAFYFLLSPAAIYELKYTIKSKIPREMEEIIVLTSHKSKFTLSWPLLAKITPDKANNNPPKLVNLS